MASYTISQMFTTISITTGGDDVTTRAAWTRIKNLGANPVSFSEAAAVASGPAAAGNQSTLIAAGSGGKADDALLPPGSKIFFKAGTGATLIAFEEVYTIPQKQNSGTTPP